MRLLLLGAGLCLLVGGAMFAWMATNLRRTGKPWLGSALGAGAALLYAAVVLSGNFIPSTARSAVLVAVVAVVMWVGVVLTLRERRKA